MAQKGKKRSLFSDEWRANMSTAKVGENNSMYGKNHKDSSIDLIRQKATGRKQSQETINKTRQTKIDKGIFWKPDDPEYLEFKKYRRKVYYWTSKNDLTQLENYNQRGRVSFHLDHKYSITEGFKNKVPPKVIGSIDNLEFICYTDNLRKGTKCSITLEKLYGLQ